MAFGNRGIWWNELMTRDVDRAISFYETVLGWQFDLMPFSGEFPEYHLAMKDGRPVAGLVDITGVPYFDKSRDFWLPFLDAPDCDSAVMEAGASGGRLLRGPFNLPNVGRVAILTDGGGALMGLVTPAARN